MPKRRHKPSNAEEDTLQRRSHWAKRLNQSISAEDKAAHARCRQLIDNGYAAVEWSELLGER